MTNSGTDIATPALLAENGSITTGALVFEAHANTGKMCTIDISGSLTCSGAKSAVVPVENGVKMVALYAEESTGNWFEDFGSGQLVDGVATVALDPTYAQTVNTHIEYHVFLTPNDDCNGLYVIDKTPGYFEVRELKAGHSNIKFDYRVIAKRKGYEEVRLEDRTAMMKAVEGNAAHFRRKPAVSTMSSPATIK
jgi:hypothetical protein